MISRRRFTTMGPNFCVANVKKVDENEKNSDVINAAAWPAFVIRAILPGSP